MAKNLKTIFILIGDIDSRDFFIRLAEPLQTLGYTIIFLTFNYYVYRLNQKASCGYAIEIIANTDKASDLDIDASQAVEVLSGQTSQDKALQSAHAMALTAEQLAIRHDPQLVFVFNGHHALGIGLTAWAKSRNLPVLYFELANLPGKIQVDPHGVNAKLKIAIKPSLWDALPPPTETFHTWHQNYRQQCYEHKHRSKSAKIQSFRSEALYNHYGTRLKNVVNLSQQSLWYIVCNKLANRFCSLPHDAFDIQSSPFIFYPMQVMDDTQLWNNSNIRNKEAIAKAYTIARERGLSLIVKGHPHERNSSHLKDVYQHFKNHHQLYFIDNNIYEIIRQAQAIVTINSSVGLEALLHGKEVIVLGNAIYKDLTADKIYRFIEHYLVDVDYFNPKPISESQAQFILDKLYI